MLRNMYALVMKMVIIMMELIMYPI